MVVEVVVMVVVVVEREGVDLMVRIMKGKRGAMVVDVGGNGREGEGMEKTVNGW